MKKSILSFVSIIALSGLSHAGGDMTTVLEPVVEIPEVSEEVNGFYVSASIYTPATNLEVSDSYAGASGYVHPTLPTGKLGALSTDEKASFGFALGYKIDEHFRLEVSYMKFDYGTTRWGTDFISFDGTYNPASSTPFVGNLDSDTYFLGGIYEQNFAEDWSWQVGAAIGLAQNKFHKAQESTYAEVSANTKNEFAYKIDAGLGYKLTDNIKVIATVGLVDIGNFESDDSRTFVGGGDETIAPYKFETTLQPIAGIGLSYCF